MDLYETVNKRRLAEQQLNAEIAEAQRQAQLDAEQERVAHTSQPETPEPGKEEKREATRMGYVADQSQKPPTIGAPGIGFTNSRAWRPPAFEKAPEIVEPEASKPAPEPNRDLEVDFAQQGAKVQDIYDSLAAGRIDDPSRTNGDGQVPNFSPEVFAKNAAKLNDLYDTLVQKGDSSYKGTEEDRLKRSRQSGNGRDDR